MLRDPFPNGNYGFFDSPRILTICPRRSPLPRRGCHGPSRDGRGMAKGYDQRGSLDRCVSISFLPALLIRPYGPPSPRGKGVTSRSSWSGETGRHIGRPLRFLTAGFRWGKDRQGHSLCAYFVRTGTNWGVIAPSNTPKIHPWRTLFRCRLCTRFSRNILRHSF